MTELYRGLLLVLTSKFYELVLSFRTHVQSFNQKTSDPTNYFDVGVYGFWNLMLEVTLTIFSLLCMIIGVTLIALMAVVFYPFHAVLRYASLLLKNTRNPPNDQLIVGEKIQPTFDDNPVIIKKDGTEKE